MKASDVIAFGALLLSGLIYMNVGRKPVFWLLLIVGFAALGASIFSRNGSKHRATTQSGENNVQQSTGDVSGGSTVNQASGNSTIINAPNAATIINFSGNITIINPGVTPETVQKALSDASAAMRPDLLAKYPLGYVLVGAANGQLVFQPAPAVLVFDDKNRVSMTIDEKSGKVRFGFEYFKVGTADWHSTLQEVGLNLPLRKQMDGLRAKLPIHLQITRELPVTIWVEVLDFAKKTFVVGFTRE